MGSFWGVHPVPRESTKLAKFSTELNLHEVVELKGLNSPTIDPKESGPLPHATQRPSEVLLERSTTSGGCWARDVHRYGGFHLDDVALTLFPKFTKSLPTPT